MPVATAAKRIVEGEQYLLQLQEEIWRGKEIKRKLSGEELEYIKSVIHHFVVVPRAGAFGFELVVYPYTDEDIRILRPDTAIISVTARHLPAGISEDFENAWKVLSPMCFNENNRRKLAYYRIDLRYRAEYKG